MVNQIAAFCEHSSPTSNYRSRHTQNPDALSSRPGIFVGAVLVWGRAAHVRERGTNIANTELADGSRGEPFLKHFKMLKLVLRGAKIFHIRSAMLKKTGDQ